MPQVTFTRWCIDPKGRTPISVDPARVDCTEFFSDSFTHAGTGEGFPGATRIIMRNKQEYLVQGSHEEIIGKLNGGEK